MTSKIRLSQLQELCQQRGLECAGLKNAHVLALLKQVHADAAGWASADADENGGAQESDEESELNVRYDDGVSDNVDVNGAKESEAIVALKLKLQLQREKAEGKMRLMIEKARLAEVEWLREKERIEPLGANGAAAHDDAAVGSSSGSREYRGKFSHMADDPLALFHALEKFLELNSIPWASWSRLVPPLLSPKAVIL